MLKAQWTSYLRSVNGELRVPFTVATPDENVGGAIKTGGFWGVSLRRIPKDKLRKLIFDPMLLPRPLLRIPPPELKAIMLPAQLSIPPIVLLLGSSFRSGGLD